YNGSSPEECLRYAVACGAESTQRLGAGLIDPKGVDQLLPEVELERIEAPARAL
ncbi:MAG: 1-phosphofructokinase family hexose kinase, partial [Solirubrobacteraceae bacterium]|nr:1-phosphofructokinase family hexose kinase [Solirubrobacteraceae bacterium]